MRLTLKQQKMVRQMDQCWDRVFWLPWEYGFLYEKGLIRQATKEERDRYYDALRRQLDDLDRRIQAALENEQYDRIKEYAGFAHTIATEIRERSQTELDKIATWSDAGVEYVKKMYEKEIAEAAK